MLKGIRTSTVKAWNILKIIMEILEARTHRGDAFCTISISHRLVVFTIPFSKQPDQRAEWTLTDLNPIWDTAPRHYKRVLLATELTLDDNLGCLNINSFLRSIRFKNTIKRVSPPLTRKREQQEMSKINWLKYNSRNNSKFAFTIIIVRTS